MYKKKVDINSTEPIKSIAEVDMVYAAFEKRGGYITLDEDMKIRKRISSRNHLAYWINYVKTKLVYKKQAIVNHITKAHATIKGKITSRVVSAPIVKTQDRQETKVVSKRSLNVDRYSFICKEDPKLRPYQQKAKKEIFESWDEVDNVMLQMPTGTGKTRLFTSIISDINKYSLTRKEPVKILIIAHRTELIDQIDDSLRKYAVPHSKISRDKERDYKMPVIVASIQTITHPNNLNDAKKLNVRFVIIDEAHHALAATYKKLWEMYPGSKKLGVTATPWRMNHQSFTDLFDKLVLSMPIKDFIKQGYLAPYKYFSLRSDSDILNTIDDIELDKFGEYKESSMEEKMDIGSIRAQLLDSYLSLAEGKKGIIYAINIVHAKHICNEYEKAGYKAVSIDSKTPTAERQTLVNDFKKGKIDIIVNVDIFSEGFDCPDIEFIQLARPTRSLVKYLQQVGRGLRLTENKQNCIILDNVGMYSKFGLPDARRHWKYHFLGKNVDEEPAKVISKGTGQSRYIDFSEGTEDMELIQDLNDVAIIDEVQNEKSFDINDFFPLFGVTLGKTTWKDVEDKGYKVIKWEKGHARYVIIDGVSFWDHSGEGVFTSLYWTREDCDFPPQWKSKGFSWDISYNEWVNVFKALGFNINVNTQPGQAKNLFNDVFDALSPDKTLDFTMEFGYEEISDMESSPTILESISVSYKGVPLIIDDETEKVESFDPTPLLEANNYQDDNFIFWFNDTRKIYEAYIHDDTYFVISELVVDESNHSVHRVRVGKIPMDSWMFWQMEREKVDNLKSITHYGAHYTLFHYQVSQSDGTIKDKYFDYKGREIDDPDWVRNKYEEACKEQKLGDYVDVPISKATFTTVLTENTIFVFRHLKGHSESLAMIPVKSDFGESYYYSAADKNRLKTSDSYTIYWSDEKSFTVRCKDNNYLYKYDFNGKLIKKGTIAAYIADTGETVSTLSDSDIDKLWHVFDYKATSYKYFWFFSIMQLYKENGNATIDHKLILARMISNAWKYVLSEKAKFPESDQLPNYIDKVMARYILDASSDRKKIEGQILYYYDRSYSESFLSPLLKNVPYRFLSPWIPFTNNDAVIAKSNEKDAVCPYSLHEDYIEINPRWSSYLINNYDKIVEFIEKELRVYLKCEEVVKPLSITEFTRRCRELQGSFREKMKEPMGVGPFRDSVTKQINMLVDGEKTGKNFVNAFTFNYARQRVKNLQPHETINEYRLFNNMLSSQPMAFNLFCPLMKMLKDGKFGPVNNIFKAIFPDMHISMVTEIDLEYLHTDIKYYLNDCTAMDAIVRYKDTDNKPAFIAIETKYTDVLGENTSNKERAQLKYREWIKRIGMFKPETEKDLLEGKKVISQIYRNFLLTECYGIRENASRCYSVVLAPAQHPTTEKEVASLKNELKPEYQYKISTVTLEDFVEKALKYSPSVDRAPFRYFKERYLS